MNEILDELNNADRAELEADETKPVEATPVNSDPTEVF